MEVIVVMPFEQYKSVLARCDASWPEHELLRSGFISYEDGEDVVQIPCDFEAAEELLDLARCIHPEAVLVIENSIHLRRQL